MSTLMKEAIADAKTLRETAEQNAKNAIIAAVAPKIRMLIEKQLGEAGDMDDDILLDGDDELPPEPTIPTPSPAPVAPTSTAAGNGTSANISLPGSDGKITVDLDSLKTDKQTPGQVGMGGGDMPANSGDVPVAGTMDVTLDDDALNALGGLGESIKSAIFTKIVETEVGLRSLKSSFNEMGPTKARIKAGQLKAIIEATYRKAKNNKTCLDEPTAKHIEERLETLYSSVNGIMSKAQVSDLKSRISKLNERVMSFRDISKSKLTPGAKAKFGTFLNELDSEISGASKLVSERSCVIDSHIGEILRAGHKLLDMYKEIKEMSMRNGTLLTEEDIMLRLTLPEDSELEASDLGVEVVDDEDGDGDADDFGGGDDLEGLDDMGGDMDEEGGDDFDLDGLGGEEDEESVEEMSEGQHDNDKGPGDDALDENEVVEIDEAMLRSEILRMRQLAEARKKKAKKDDKKKGKKDVKEGVKVGKPESTGTSGPGSYEDFGGGHDEGHLFVDNTYSEIQKESRRNRALLRKLGEYKTAFERAREKLAEVNLFNAKLLYANKLLQNTNITPRQRESAIDSLDSAKSLREVKLVYSSLIGATRSGKSGINESATRSRGSSSRPARSGAATLNEAAEVRRWALLAGITDGKDNA